MKANQTLTPAVAYIRMSSGKQEASPDQQRAEVAKLAKRHNCRIIREYFDEGISGDATEKRKAFQEMVRDAEEKGDFAAILCWDQDRFGRFDSIEAGRWIYPLRQAGVWLITVAQGQIDWNDFAGRMMYSIQQEGKHQYLVDLSRNVLRGRIASAKRGSMVVRPPYGYDRVFYDAAGKLVKRVPWNERFNKPAGWTVKLAPAANHQEVEVVQWLFGEFANSDRSLRSLVVELNNRGIPTRRGGPWTAVSITYILTHPTYTGAATFGRRRGGKYHHMGAGGEITKGGGRRRDGEPIIVEQTHEGLIDAEMFNAVQAKLQARKTTRTKPRYNGYILNGVLRCGHCGRRLFGACTGGKDHPHLRYYCCSGIKDGLCKRYMIRQDALDAFVLDTLHQRLFNPHALEQITRAIHRRVKGNGTFKANVAQLKTRLGALERKIAKGSENLLLANPEDIPELSALLADWRRDRERLQSELEALAAKPNGGDAEQRASRAVKELGRLRDHLATGDPSRVRAVVKALVEGIELWWESAGRYRKLSRGVLTLRQDVGVLKGSSSTAGKNWCRRLTGSDDP